MGDTYSSFPSLLEEYAKTVVSADAWLATVSGTRLACKTFEQGLRPLPKDYNMVELPAVVFSAEMPDEDVPTALSTEGERAILTAYVIVSHADMKTRRTLALDIGARIRRIFREQISGGAWSDLDTVVPGAVSGSISTTVSGPILDDVGQTEQVSTSRLAVATVVAAVEVDVDATI